VGVRERLTDLQGRRVHCSSCSKEHRRNSSLRAECVLTEQVGVVDCTGKVPRVNRGQVIYGADRVVYWFVVFLQTDPVI
jgi:hypothetical protein